MPGGILVAPGKISETTVKHLKDQWESNYSGKNAGKVAVLGDGLKYERMTLTAMDAQLIEQLKWTAENICSCFHMPPHMVGVGPAPSYNNIQALTMQYYSQCLQTHIEAIEALLDDGLVLPKKYRTEFDLDDLLRMDTMALILSEKEAVGAGIKAPNEARARLNLPPVTGGESPMMQEQNYSLEALSKRPNAPATPAPAPDVPPGGQADPEDPEDDDEEGASEEDKARQFAAFTKGFCRHAA
jgi:HK97 family phage portal protein